MSDEFFVGSHGERVLPRRDWYWREKSWAPGFGSGWGVPVTAEEDEWCAEHWGRLAESIKRLEERELPESAGLIADECDQIKEFLVGKNLAYGNSALEPVRVFSSATTVEQLLVRIDDKLSRMQRGFEHGSDDTTLDLIGYLILLRIAYKKESGDAISG